MLFYQRKVQLGFDSQTPRPTKRVSFDLEELNFSRGAKKNAFWIPEALTPLSYLPVYKSFDEPARILYNQKTALALAEKYIFLEDLVLAPAIEALLRSSLVVVDAEARSEMAIFCEEEKKHSEAFWRLLEAAAPELYPQRRFRYMRLGMGAKAFLKACEQFPCQSTAWIWLALFFEELTIRISRQYAREKDVDSLFRDVHHAHMVEESAHVPLDRMLLARIFDEQSSVGRKASLKLFEVFLSRFSAPRHTPLVIFEELVGAFPNMRRLSGQVREDLDTLPENSDFQSEFYSSKSAPLTYKLLEKYPEAQGFLMRSVPCAGVAS